MVTCQGGFSTASSSILTNVLPSGKIFVGNAANIATPQTMSGDVTINNSAVATIGNGVVTNAKLAGGITDDKLASVYLYANGSRMLTNNWNVGAFSITNITSTSITGTGGSGYTEYTAQSLSPSAPAAVGMRLYAFSTGDLAWVTKNGSDTFYRRIAGTLTANRTYTLQDKDMTFASTDTQTFTGLTTFDRFDVVGLSGNGYGGFIAQSSNVTAPAATGFRWFANSAGSPAWAKKNGSDTFVRAFASTNTADRTYTWQNSSYTVAGLDIVQTFTAAQTFNNSNLLLRNPADTFSYTIVPSAIAASRNLTVPLLTADDTFAVLGLAQTFTQNQTFTTGGGTTTLATGSTTLNLFNATATTVNFAGAATTIAIGAASAVTTFTGTTSQVRVNDLYVLDNDGTTYKKALVSNTANTVLDVGTDFVTTDIYSTTNSARVARFAGQATAVNYTEFRNSASASPVQILASGTDSNINIQLVPKGTGLVSFSTATAAGVSAFTVTNTITGNGASQIANYNARTGNTANSSELRLVQNNASGAATCSTFVWGQSTVITAASEETKFGIDTIVSGARTTQLTIQGATMTVIPVTNCARINISQATAGVNAQTWTTVVPLTDPTLSLLQDQVTTTNATPTTLHTFSTSSSTIYVFKCTVVMTRTGGSAGAAGDSGSFEITGMYKNIGGTVSLLFKSSTVGGADQAWTIDLSISGTNVLLQVTGTTNNNITWTLTKAEIHTGGV